MADNTRRWYEPPKWSDLLRWARILIGIIIGAVVVYVLAVHVPPLLVEVSSETTADRRSELENDVRSTLLGSLAGVLFPVTAFFTWRQVQVAQRRLDVEQQGQVTERFSRAVEQLGYETVDVRLGGLFSLERLAVEDPERFAANVYEILVAYLREHTRPERYDLTKKERHMQMRLVGSPGSTSLSVSDGPGLVKVDLVEAGSL
jgi:hypothetical protein